MSDTPTIKTVSATGADQLAAVYLNREVTLDHILPPAAEGELGRLRVRFAQPNRDDEHRELTVSQEDVDCRADCAEPRADERPARPPGSEELVQPAQRARHRGEVPVSSNQKKMLGIIKADIEAMGLEAVSRPQYANTGVISVERAGRMGSLGEVDYRFNDAYVMLQLRQPGPGGRMAGIPSQPGRPDYYDWYTEYHDSALFERFRCRLTELCRQVGGAQPNRDDEHRELTVSQEDVDCRVIMAPVILSRELMNDVMCIAAEGGIGYWSSCRRYDWTSDVVLLHIVELDENERVPSKEKAIKDGLWDGKVTHTHIALGIQRILSGAVSVNGETKQSVFLAATSDDACYIDASDADAIIQAGILGELRYG